MSKNEIQDAVANRLRDLSLKVFTHEPGPVEPLVARAYGPDGELLMEWRSIPEYMPGPIRTATMTVEHSDEWVDLRVEDPVEVEDRDEHPHVIPVMVFWRHHGKFREDYDWSDEWDLLRAAYRFLESMREYEEGAPDGVEVGGYLYTMNELSARYGRDSDR